MTKILNIRNKVYTEFNPYIIAEIGVNHAGDMKLAKQMIESVADGGGHAAKFQSYKADKIASKSHSPSYWDTNEEPTTSQHELFQKFDSFGEAQYKELADYCKEVGVDFLSTPFDLDAVDYLTPLMPCFKIASADITNIPLIRKIGKQGKPIIMSTGASKLFEIENALQILDEVGANDITLLHCVLNYPTPKENAQMYQMRVLAKTFGDKVNIGYSDHVKPNSDGTMPSLEIAVLSGAVVLEKHFTYDKTLKGNDHYHAMDEKDLLNFSKKIEELRLLMGSEKREINLESSAIQNARRRIVLNKNLKKGDALSEKNLIALRANIGIEIAHWDSVLGKKLKTDLGADTPVKWSDLE